MFQDRCQQLLARVKELVQKANQLYNIQLPKVEVSFDLRGRAAGQAYRKFNRYGVRFNRDMIMNSGYDHILNDTASHEVAHIVGFYTGRDRAHGVYWRSVCRALGGSGERCHSEEVTYAKGRTFYYTTSTGQVVAMSQTRHKKIQQGTVYRLRNGSGFINRDCSYSRSKPTAQPQPQPKAQVLANKPVAKTGSNAERLRAALKQFKADLGSEAFEHTVNWAMTELGMSCTLARTYVKGNWNKV